MIMGSGFASQDVAFWRTDDFGDVPVLRSKVGRLSIILSQIIKARTSPVIEGADLLDLWIGSPLRLGK
ncbi:MAG: hypothetical protein AAGC81_09050 [Pseudomonadota bacterium]